MGLTYTGIVKSFRPIVADDGSYAFCALDLVTDNGTYIACQVWSNDKQYQDLYNAGEQLLHHKVKVSVLNYSVGRYTDKNGTEKRQLRFRITNVRDLGIPPQENELVGVVTSARPIAAQDGSYQFLAIDIITGRGVTYACQVWGDDPQYVALGPIVEQFVDHKVAVSVVGCSVGLRTMKDNSQQLQARFRITNVRDLGVSIDEEAA